MDATLDFVRRARHAWSEFRQPNAPTGQQSGHPEDQHGNGNHWRPDPSLNNPNERSALENYRLLVGSMWIIYASSLTALRILTRYNSPPG